MQGPTAVHGGADLHGAPDHAVVDKLHLSQLHELSNCLLFLPEASDGICLQKLETVSDTARRQGRVRRTLNHWQSDSDPLPLDVACLMAALQSLRACLWSCSPSARACQVYTRRAPHAATGTHRGPRQSAGSSCPARQSSWRSSEMICLKQCLSCSVNENNHCNWPKLRLLSVCTGNGAKEGHSHPDRSSPPPPRPRRSPHAFFLFFCAEPR